MFNFVNNLFNSWIINKVNYWAKTGENTDECYKRVFLPVPVHFYQPIPDIKDLERRKIWEKVNKLHGIEFIPKKYLKTIKDFGTKYASECDWPNDPTNNPDDFYLNNSCFSYGCAAVLHCMIRKYKPHNIIEIGSGNSSKIIRDAILLNEKDTKKPINYTIIDPYSNLNKKSFTKNTIIIKEKVEELDPKFFKILQKNDILFIDSSHVSKIGSDVNFEILEVLPILNKGAFVHFHDVNLPFEYPKVYATNPKFRMFWTESYLLQAFLCCNKDYEIVLPMSYIQQKFDKEFRKAFPSSNKAINYGSGSFWIRKVN